MWAHPKQNTRKKAGMDIKTCTVRVDSLPHRKSIEIKQQPGTAGPGNMLGCCLIYFHFRWGKLSTLTVQRCTKRLVLGFEC